MKKNIKSWLVTASAPFCGTDTHYTAFSEGDPLDAEGFPYNDITDELWGNYSYLLHLDDEEYESEEEREEALEQAYEDWACDCSFDSQEMSLEELQDYIPGGATYEGELPEIIYDERDGE